MAGHASHDRDVRANGKTGLEGMQQNAWEEVLGERGEKGAAEGEKEDTTKTPGANWCQTVFESFGRDPSDHCTQTHTHIVYLQQDINVAEGKIIQYGSVDDRTHTHTQAALC